MEIFFGIAAGVIILGGILFALYEYRIRQANMLVLYETQDGIGIRKGLVYPRHFSLVLQRTTWPIQFTVETTAAGNLGVRVQVIGSVAPALDHI